MYLKPEWQDSSILAATSPKNGRVQMAAKTSMGFRQNKVVLGESLILSHPVRNKCMSLYISALDSTIESMLSQEDDNGVERAIYYISRVLNDA